MTFGYVRKCSIVFRKAEINHRQVMSCHEVGHRFEFSVSGIVEHNLNEYSDKYNWSAVRKGPFLRMRGMPRKHTMTV